MSSGPLVLSPALPSELLTYILDSFVYPTTLIICSTRQEFLQDLADDVQQHDTPDESADPDNSEAQDNVPDRPRTPDSGRTHRLLASPLYQVAISRHIRTVYAPTVTHLRAYLSVFSPQDSKAPSPPQSFNPIARNPTHLIVYGLIGLQRDTSEWSAQGLSNTAAALVETGQRLGWSVVMIEPRGGGASFEDLLRETVPVLSGDAPRNQGWSRREVEIGRVLGRWFRFHRADWDEINHQTEMQEQQDVDSSQNDSS